jgi:hypothetical protein
MSVAPPLADHPFVWNARNLTKHIVPVLMAFLFLALSLPGQSAPPAPAPPAFPVGNITATIIVVGTGTHPTLTWTTALPENATSADYVFYIRQKQLQSGINWDIPVQSEGETMSPLALDTTGSTFELWAIKATSPQSECLLDTTTVGGYLPAAGVTIRTEDPYPTLPRTRADRPILVDVNVQGLISHPDAPESLSGTTLLRHVQSYGATGMGHPLDRTLATLLSQNEITSNGMITVSIPLNAIPGTNPAKVRGEERFTILSKPDYQTPEYILASQFVQVWPVADATISGIAQGEVIGASVPELTFQLNDLYPSSTTWAHLYKGGPQTGITGTTIPGSSIVINGSVPTNRTIIAANYDPIFDSDGVWTMELLTSTPFGTDRLAQVSFIVQRAGMALADWRQAHFGSDLNSGDGADANDYDKDGIENLIEFAFGLDPKQNSAGQLPVAERIGDQFSIRFTPPAGIAGILHGAEWSSTLQPDSWLPVVNTGELPEHAFSVPVNGKSRLFLRLKATAP